MLKRTKDLAVLTAAAALLIWVNAAGAQETQPDATPTGAGSANAEASSAPPAPVTVDLLALLDEEPAAAAGEWRKHAPGLQASSTTSARILVAEVMPDEYDLQVRFTRIDGRHSVAIIFPTTRGQATYELDAWGEHLAGIQMVNGQSLKDRPDRKRVQLENGRTYTASLQVRGGRVRAMLDGEVIDDVELTSEVRLTPLSGWDINNTRGLGVGAYQAPTVFHSIRVTSMPLIEKSWAAPPPDLSRGQSRTRTGDVSLLDGRSAKDDGREGRMARLAAVAGVAMPADAGPTDTEGASEQIVSAARPGETAEEQPPVAATDDDIAALSDEFDDAKTLRSWKRVFREEGWPGDQLARLSINRDGWLVAVPHTSSWYNDYRGILVHREVRGDFVVTMHLRTTNRQGNGAPGRDYSLAGIMIRSPRDITPETWQPGGENYIFLSHGTANRAGAYQYEVKTTERSQSTLAIQDAPGDEATLRAARIGDVFVLLRRSPGEAWVVHQRYRRADMPQTLQVGLTTYTDWPNVQRQQPRAHNMRPITNGRPDLIANVDFIRFRRPGALPAAMRGRNLADPQQVSDAQLLDWLAD